MGRRTVAQFAHQIKRVLSPTMLNDLGRRVGFCHRERLMTPYRLVLGLLAGHATGTVETLADMQRQFNALFGTTVACKPFHDPLAKRSFKDFASGAGRGPSAMGGGRAAADGAGPARWVRSECDPGRMLVRGQGRAS